VIEILGNQQSKNALKRVMKIYPPFLFIALVLGSCSQKEGCTDFGAENYDTDAVLNDGSCVKVSDKFVGEYIVDSDCFDGFYRMKVEKTNDDYKVRIKGLADTLQPIDAEIIAGDLVIRQLEISHHVFLEGAGTSIGGGISMSYHVRDETSGQVVFQDCLQWCSEL
jgi:hypothetical protein